MNSMPLLVASVLAFTLSLQAHALGLGKLTIESSLSQPLSANMPIKLSGTETIEDVRVSLASQEIFKAMGVDYNFEHAKVAVAVDTTNPKQAFVTFTTKQPVNEPFIQLVVNVKTPTQQFNRSLTLLLDAPNNDDAPSVF